jgi:hypothetical protein
LSQSLGATKYQLFALFDFRELGIDDLFFPVMPARAAGPFRSRAAGGPT